MIPTPEWDSVIPIEQEINKTKRQLDDAEWEGEPCEHLRRHLKYLIEQQLNGETWYANF